MQLKLTRSQRAGGMLGGKVFFSLNARADFSEEERSLVKKYDLGKIVVYDSDDRKKHGATMLGHFAEAGVVAGGAGKSLWNSARGLASAAMTALSLRVTVDSLAAGQHIECKDLTEVLGAEAAIREACETLKTYLDIAVCFDGREEVVEY